MNNKNIRRIAMWSGPRNISTTLMRSWGNRPDTLVVDEPFYAYYLKNKEYINKNRHPGYKEILNTYDTDPDKLVFNLTKKNLPDNKTVQYQKHMTHHLTPELRGVWLSELFNCFLIRDPKEVLLSLSKKTNDLSLEDIGIKEQVEIYNYINDKLKQKTLIIDSKDVLLDPKNMLIAICNFCDIKFSDKMLTWSTGPRESDGIWGKYWYHNLYKSTKFKNYKPKQQKLSKKLMSVYQKALPYYEDLSERKLTI